jgi:hypothetical protein
VNVKLPKKLRMSIYEMSDINSKRLLQKDFWFYKLKKMRGWPMASLSLDHCLIGWLEWELGSVKETR